MIPEPASQPVSADRDRGAALPLVLVMMVILALVIIPTLNYAVSVTAANNVLSDKNERVEAVKAGLRIALSDPQALFEECNSSNSGFRDEHPLASVSLNGHSVDTLCYLQDTANALAGDELRVGVASTRLGTAPPVELRGSSYWSAGSEADWLGIASAETVTDQIWLPRLPVTSLTLENRDGRQMSEGFATCTVYFPGTYLDEVVLDGPTFFTSGVYYFENEVRVVGGADVVVGGGAVQGCTTDLDAIFYTENPPASVSMSGLGSTFVFGDRGRLLVDNSDGGDLSLVFNRRYAPEEDPTVAPSEDVSIISVNGTLDVDDDLVDLLVAGDLQVPRSMVGAGDTPEEADTQGFVPSRFTPQLKEPEAPSNVDAVAYNRKVVVSWDAPYDNYDPITGYTVTASPSGETCTTAGVTSCVVEGLDDDDLVRFSVVATNASGDSIASAASDGVTPDGSSLPAPERPDEASVEAFNEALRVSWTAPTSDAPVTSYEVTAQPGDHTCVLDVVANPRAPLTCDVQDLDAEYLPGYEVTVVAESAGGTSPASNRTSPIEATGDPLPAAEPDPAAVITGTPPVVDVDLADGASAVVAIPGYVATPQGRFRVSNPNGHAVTIGGGILAAELDVVDARMTTGTAESVNIGFINQELQRRYLLVSSISGEYEKSRAVVQVNENGSYAVNSWEVQ